MKKKCSLSLRESIETWPQQHPFVGHFHIHIRICLFRSPLPAFTFLKCVNLLLLWKLFSHLISGEAFKAATAIQSIIIRIDNTFICIIFQESVAAVQMYLKLGSVLFCKLVICISYLQKSLNEINSNSFYWNYFNRFFNKKLLKLIFIFLQS